jgi:signal transduction histidine kinase
LVHDVVALHEVKAASQGVRIVARVAGGLPQLEMDREAMHAAVNNLVTNSLDACLWDPDVDKRHEVIVEAGMSSDGGVMFVVRDNGMGMSKEHQAKALSVCFTTKGIRGTGLGLLLCKKTAQEHGGTMDFISTPGQGTEFRIAIPSRGSRAQQTSTGAGHVQEDPSR